MWPFRSFTENSELVEYMLAYGTVVAFYQMAISRENKFSEKVDKGEYIGQEVSFLEESLKEIAEIGLEHIKAYDSKVPRDIREKLERRKGISEHLGINPIRAYFEAIVGRDMNYFMERQ